MASQHRDVQVRQADPERDRDTILAVLSRSHPSAAATDRYAWLYLSNPHGRARVWLAEDAETGEPVGASAGHPKRVWADGAAVDVLDLGDFAFEPAYRTLGPALKLLRATLEPMDRGDFAFSYDHPNRAMLAVYQRMGGRDLSARRRWVRLLKVSPQLERRVGGGLGSRLLGQAGDLALRARDAIGGRRGDVTVEPLAGDCGPEFDRLDADLSRATRFRGVRSAAHVRWRYLRNVTARHEILCARRDGALVGWLAMRPRDPDVLAIDDLVAADPAVPAALLDAAAAAGHRRGASALSATVLRDSPVEALFPAGAITSAEEIAAYEQQYPVRLQFAYGTPKYEKPFLVRAIWNDGQFTYIKAEAKELPALYEVKDGAPALVNFQVQGGTYVVPKLLEHGYLALGKERFAFQQGQ